MSAAGRVVVPKARTARRQPKAVLQLTERAAGRIAELLEKRQAQEDVRAVRVGIKSRGCNGLSYTMEYASEKKRLEEEVNEHGVTVYVESRALMHIIGTEMDYVQDDLTSEFVFHNPNAEGACGCGESFTTTRPPGKEEPPS